MPIDNSIAERAQKWLSDFFDPETKKEIRELLQQNPGELEDRFYKTLEFGTGGMRGIMGAGTNRINKYTLGKSTQGLSNYLKSTFGDEEIKVVIAYDCRHNSQSLARTVAEVFSANDIDVYLFSELRTTPELSFAVRYLGCHAGVVLTASHNPPEYNGYKVYWQDGGQIVPPEDGEIIAAIDRLDYEDIRFQAQPERIQEIDREVDEAFLEASVKNGSFGVSGKEDLSIVFTSLHGTSVTAIPEVLSRAGYENVTQIPEQAVPDGDFPTVESPNPEEPEALKMALTKGAEINADIVIGTDPDSDRLGIAVRNETGALELLNGNQTMVLMTRFLLERQREKGFQGNEFIATTIVSTPMMQSMADVFGVECKTSLTGFKWIAKMIRDFPAQRFIGGGEESFGYMVGDFVRDKDAVTASLLACEIATWAKARGSSFYRELLQCYVAYGCYRERLVSLTKKGMDGAAQIGNMMKGFRENPLHALDGSPVIRIDDYQNGTSKNPKTGEITKIDLPNSNVLIYTTADGTRLAARPSGTEPKIKFYVSVRGSIASGTEYQSEKQALESKIDRVLEDLKLEE
jgi:phosphoglucomutase